MGTLPYEGLQEHFAARNEGEGNRYSQQSSNDQDATRGGLEQSRACRRAATVHNEEWPSGGRWSGRKAANLRAKAHPILPVQTTVHETAKSRTRGG